MGTISCLEQMGEENKRRCSLAPEVPQKLINIRDAVAIMSRNSS